MATPAERTGVDNELATTVSPATQRHIRRVQRQDGTPPTSSGASREGEEVAMSPDGGDTSPPTELSAGDGPVVLQCTDCCTPQTQPRRRNCVKKGQSQTFSGVGAQHQNARAERAIQTIMYMA